ncbi:MAG: phosphatase PAP2 family protein [Acidobacteriota bacterium]
MPKLSPPARVALEKFVIAAVVYAFIGFGYLIVNHAVEGRQFHELWTPVDRAAPFWQGFIWAYYLVFVTPLSILLFVDRIEHIRRAGLALVMNVLVAFPVFVLYPVTMPRPAAEQLVWNVSGYATDFIWQLDKPINCFPSIHVSLAVTAGFIVSRFHRSAGLVVHFCALAISVSTIFVKQHFLLDVVSGFLLGAGSYWLAFVKDVAAPLPFFQASAAS